MKLKRVVSYFVGIAVVLGTWTTLMIVALRTQRTDTAYWGAVVGGIQAAVVVMVLVIGLWTLRRDSRDRRVDRVYALHKELTVGEVGASRARLGSYLRKGNPTHRENDAADLVARVTLSDLRDCVYARQPPEADKNVEEPFAQPRRDATMVLRFFERAWAARTGDSLDDAMFCALIGRHATWWDDAISSLKVTTGRRPLLTLAAWANDYQAKHPKSPGLENWRNTREEDFPSLYTDGKRVVMTAQPAAAPSAQPPPATTPTPPAAP